jgi:hypothetical protein
MAKTLFGAAFLAVDAETAGRSSTQVNKTTSMNIQNLFDVLTQYVFFEIVDWIKSAEILFEQKLGLSSYLHRLTINAMVFFSPNSLSESPPDHPDRRVPGHTNI